MQFDQAIAFFGTIVALTLMPGADMALVSRVAISHGRRALIPTLLGIETAIAVHVTCSIAGLTLVIARSEVAWTTLRLAGAAWLVWLGLQSLMPLWRDRAGSADVATASSPADISDPGVPPSTRRLYLQGMLTNLLNPKIGLFYAVFLPQFADPGPGFVPRAIVLAAIQAALGMAWLITFALLVERSAKGATRWRAHLVERACGAALVAFGVRLAFFVR